MSDDLDEDARVGRVLREIGSRAVEVTVYRADENDDWIVRVVSPECDSIYRAATLVEALANASLKGEK